METGYDGVVVKALCSDLICSDLFCSVLLCYVLCSVCSVFASLSACFRFWFRCSSFSGRFRLCFGLRFGLRFVFVFAFVFASVFASLFTCFRFCFRFSPFCPRALRDLGLLAHRYRPGWRDLANPHTKTAETPWSRDLS